MKSLKSKLLIVGIFSLFFTILSFGTTYKLGLMEPVHFGYFRGMAIYNNYAITISLYGDLCVYSIINDEYEFVSYKELNSQVTGFYENPVIYENYMYIPKREALLIFDVSELPEIRFLKSYLLDGEFTYVYSMALYGNVLALGGVTNSGSLLLSLADPENPVEITRIDGNYGSVSEIYLTDKYLISSSKQGGVDIWDVSDINNPFLLKTFSFDILRYSLLIDNNYLLVNNNYSLFLINLSDPQNIPDPVEIRSDSTNLIGGVVLNENVVLFNGSNFLFCRKSELENPSSIDWKSTEVSFNCNIYTLTNNNGIFKLFAIDSKSKKAIFSLDDTDQKVSLIGDFDKSDFLVYGDLETFNDYLYSTAYGYGLAIYRIDGEGIPQFIKTDTINNNIFYPFGIKKITVTTNKTSTDYFLIYDWNTGIILDLTDPENPQQISTINAYFKTAYYSSPYLFCFDNHHTFSIFDLTDPNSPQQLFTGDIPENQEGSIFYYDDHLYIGKYIIDVSDKTNPVVVSDTVPAKKLTGIYNYLICWPTSPSQVLKVLKLTDPENPQQVQEIQLPGTSNIYALDLFTKKQPQNEMAVCSYFAVNSSLPQTIVLKKIYNSDKFEIQYIIDSMVRGIEFGNNYAFISQEGKAPIAAYGITFSIPHIATTWGWETNLIVDNFGDGNTNFRYSINDEIIVENKKDLIEAHKQMSIPITTGQSGEVCMPFTGYLGFKVSYHHTEEHGIAEFPLSYGYFKNLTLYTPQYLAERLTWMGLAATNCGNDTINIELNAFDKKGNQLENKNLYYKPMTRQAAVLRNIFTNTNWEDIAKIRIESYGFINGITISGNRNSQLLFTPGMYDGYKLSTRYLPHIDVNGYWNTYLIMDNPTDWEITVNLKLYSEGNEVVNEQKTIPANSNLTVLLNDYANLNIDCGEVLNYGSNLVVRLSYMFQTTGATAEFLINGYEKSYELFFNLPAYRADVLTWWGIALMNPNDSTVQVTLNAYSNGQVIDTANITLNPHTKMADLIENIFPNLNGQTVERVYARATGGSILGLNICGSNQDRYLFTKAYHY